MKVESMQAFSVAALTQAFKLKLELYTAFIRLHPSSFLSFAPFTRNLMPVVKKLSQAALDQ